MKAIALIVSFSLVSAALPAQTLQEIANRKTDHITATAPQDMTVRMWRGLTESGRTAVVDALRKRAQEFREEAAKAVCCHCKELNNTRAASYEAAAEFVASYEAPIATVTLAPQG